MSSSVSGSSGSGSSSRARGSDGVEKKDKVEKKRDPKPPEVKKDEPREEEDSFETQSRPQPRRNTVQTSDKAENYWSQQAQQKDQAIQKEAKELWKNELGRDISDGEAARLGQQAQEAGCLNEREARAYFQKMISGSPEKQALNHVGAEFERLLGRPLNVAEQRAWLDSSGLDMNSKTFARDVTARIQSSEEYRDSHPAAEPVMSPNEAFITQFKSDWNPTGPTGSTNCGPSSLAMAMAYTGHMPPGLTKEQQVDHARALMHANDKNPPEGLTTVKDANGNDVPILSRDEELTGGTMEQDGITAAGGTPVRGEGWEALDKALENGPVLSNGWYGPKWREQFGSLANTGNTRTHPEGIGHVNCIMGKTPEGKYLVADPMSRNGVVEMTRDQLSKFYKNSNGSPTFEATNLGATGPAAPSTPAAPTTPTTPATPSTGELPPTGLRYDGGTKYNADVEQLQKLLVEAKLLTESDRRTGPGFYGNKTAAALAQLQREYGVPGNGRTFDEATRNALAKKLAGEAPTPVTPGTPGTPAPQGDYEKMVADAIANAPKDNASLRPYWTKFAAEVAPRLEQAGVPREQIKKAILWGLTEGTSTSGTNSKYRMENGQPTSAITYSNLGDDLSINRSTQTPTGLELDPDTKKPYTTWQVGIAGVQVPEAVGKGWLKNAFEALYPGQTPQQVGQRMLDLMGETDEKTFPNLSMEELCAVDANGNMVNGKWAAVLLRDPAINIHAMTQHGNLDHWLGVNHDRLELESPGFYAKLEKIVNDTFG